MATHHRLFRWHLGHASKKAFFEVQLIRQKAPRSPTISLLKVMELYGTEEKCEAALKPGRWPEGFICPRCGEKEHGLVYGRRLKRYPCRRSHNAATEPPGSLLSVESDRPRLAFPRWP